MSFQQCRFNFGAEEFKYPPKRPFSVFNDFGVLKPQDKVSHQLKASFKLLPFHSFSDRTTTTFVPARVEKAQRN